MACSEEAEPSGASGASDVSGKEESAAADGVREEFSIEDYVSGNPIDGSKGFAHLKPKDESDDTMTGADGNGDAKFQCGEMADQARHDECDDGPESRSSSSRKASVSSSSARTLPSSSSVATSSESANYVIKNRIVMGTAEKGPFQAQSTITLYEVTEDLNVTGRIYGTETSDNYGNFIIPVVNLTTNHVMLVAQGYYRNEVTGIWSQIPISLQAVSDLSTRNGEAFQRTEVNVNLLTHLEYERIWTLMDEGLDLAAAKKRAMAEIMDAFHFHIEIDYAEEQKLFGGRNGVLLALSILFQGNRNEVQLENAINAFIDDFSTDGVWDDKNTHAKMADFASEFNYESVHTWAAAWGVKDVPDFETHLSEFWNTAYGLDLCSAKNQGYVVANNNPYSVNYKEEYTCKDGEWVKG